MKEYFINDRGLEWVFSNLEKARKKAEEIGGKVESRILWKYYAPYYTGSQNGTRNITGRDLVRAIESNFNQILKDYDMEGLSGHILNYVAVEKAEDGAELVIDLTKLGYMGNPGQRVSKRVQIQGVEPGDMIDEKVILFEKNSSIG